MGVSGHLLWLRTGPKLRPLQWLGVLGVSRAGQTRLHHRTALNPPSPFPGFCSSIKPCGCCGGRSPVYQALSPSIRLPSYIVTQAELLDHPPTCLNTHCPTSRYVRTTLQSPSHALCCSWHADMASQLQVDSELRKMTAFIKQEAMEKAREIEIKANEEFEIEKSKLVRQETDSIDSQYEKKFKQATMSQQITRSTVANKIRLKVLGARQELLDDIFEDAQKQLAGGTKDKGRYQKILKGLLLEGFYAMNEPQLQVRARKQDYDLVKKAIDEACAEYKKGTGKEVTAKIHEEHPLPDEMCVFPLPVPLSTFILG